VWDNRFGDSTWDIKETMRETYTYLFSDKSIFGDENFSCWGECKDHENSIRLEVVQLKWHLNILLLKYK